MTTDNPSKTPFALVLGCWLLGAVMFAVMLGISIDYHRNSSRTYEDFHYGVFTFSDVSVSKDPEMGTTLCIHTAEGKTLVVNNLLSNQKLESKVKSLTPGTSLFCYYEGDGESLDVAELKAEQMILPLDAYLATYQKQGTLGLALSPVLLLGCIAGAAITIRKCKMETT